MRYFVTGGTGFIGRHLVAKLLVEGHEVVALARHPAAALELLGSGVRVHEGDITIRESMREGMKDMDGVFHLAGWYRIGAKNTGAAEEVNIVGTRNVLELMRELEIPKGVYTSTLVVFGDTKGRTVDERQHHEGSWLTEYDRTKWAAHFRVAEPMMRAGLPLVIVLPGVVYGPGDKSPIRSLLVEYLRGKLSVIPRGTAYCWAHVEDIAQAHVLAMDKGVPGESYITAGPAATLRHVLTIAEKMSGIPAPRYSAPAWTLRALSTVMRAVERSRDVPERYAAEALRVAAGVTYLGNGKKAARALGWAARPLDEGLRETLREEMRLLGMLPRG
jgi:nucleoside-diphosphate-sugar epimerase